MNNTSTLASAPLQASLPRAPTGLQVSRRQDVLATLRSLVATWRLRKRVRWELEEMSRANPHLIYDIGLTKRQVEAEIAKPFWQG